MTTVAVYSRTHSFTYVADNILKSLKDIIRLSGLDPTKLVDGWESYVIALRTWLESGHLERVVLEVFNPTTGGLLLRWDIDVVYNWSQDSGAFWTDTDQIRHAIRKAGVAPSDARYDVLLNTKAGRPDVPGWSVGSHRPTTGMVRHSLGTTIEHAGLAANTAYWRT